MIRTLAASFAACAAAFLALSAPAFAAPFETRAEFAVIMEFETGEVLFSKRADEAMPPASMSKLMTMEMLFQRLKDGSIALTDTFPVSEKAWRMGGSKMFVKVGDEVPVEALMRGVIVQSGNDACIVIAEALAGTEEAFARRMTERAREIGLTNSTFKNATGWPDEGHLMSARDLALLARHMIATYPEYYRYYAETEFTWSDIRQANRNPLLYMNIGADGVKTGHTSVSGYGLVASAVRDGRRLITVVNGLGSEQERAEEARRVMDAAFRDFQPVKLFAAGEQVIEVPVWGGAADRVGLVTPDAVSAVIHVDARRELDVRVRHLSPLKAPVAAGAPAGELVIRAPGTPERRVILTTAAEVPRAGLLQQMILAIRDLAGAGAAAGPAAEGTGG